MSGETQARRRKDKKKSRRGREAASEPEWREPLPTAADDEFYVEPDSISDASGEEDVKDHSEPPTSCLTVLVFLILTAGIGVLGGLIYIQSSGITHVPTAAPLTQADSPKVQTVIETVVQEDAAEPLGQAPPGDGEQEPHSPLPAAVPTPAPAAAPYGERGKVSAPLSARYRANMQRLQANRRRLDAALDELNALITDPPPATAEDQHTDGGDMEQFQSEDEGGASVAGNEVRGGGSEEAPDGGSGGEEFDLALAFLEPPVVKRTAWVTGEVAEDDTDGAVVWPRAGACEDDALAPCGESAAEGKDVDAEPAAEGQPVVEEVVQVVEEHIVYVDQDGNRVSGEEAAAAGGAPAPAEPQVVYVDAPAEQPGIQLEGSESEPPKPAPAEHLEQLPDLPGPGQEQPQGQEQVVVEEQEMRVRQVVKMVTAGDGSVTEEVVSEVPLTEQELQEEAAANQTKEEAVVAEVVEEVEVAPDPAVYDAAHDAGPEAAPEEVTGEQEAEAPPSDQEEVAIPSVESPGVHAGGSPPAVETPPAAHAPGSDARHGSAPTAQPAQPVDEPVERVERAAPEERSKPAEKPVEKPIREEKQAEKVAIDVTGSEKPSEVDSAKKPAEKAHDKSKPEEKSSDKAKTDEKSTGKSAGKPNPEEKDTGKKKSEQKPEDKPAEKPKEKHADKLKQKEQPSEKSAEKVKPSEKPAEKAKPSEKPAEKPAEQAKSSQKPAEKSKPSEKPSENIKPNEKPAEKPAEKAKPSKKSEESVKPQEKPAAKPAEKSEPSEKPAEKVKPSEKPTEKTAEKAKPSEESSTRPAEKSKPAEKPQEKAKTGEKEKKKQTEKLEKASSSETPREKETGARAVPDKPAARDPLSAESDTNKQNSQPKQALGDAEVEVEDERVPVVEQAQEALPEEHAAEPLHEQVYEDQVPEQAPAAEATQEDQHFEEHQPHAYQEQAHEDEQYQDYVEQPEQEHYQEQMHQEEQYQEQAEQHDQEHYHEEQQGGREEQHWQQREQQQQEPVGDWSQQEAHAQERQEPVPADEAYEHAEITNAEDWAIRDELDRAEALIDKEPLAARDAFSALLEKHPRSPRALYGRARALVAQSSVERSNNILDKAIKELKRLMTIDVVQPLPERLFRIAAEYTVQQMRFRGLMDQAARIQQRLIQRYPDDYMLRNHLATVFMTFGQNSAAEEVLVEVLRLWPDNGYAKVHLGFLRRLAGNHEDAARLMQGGIDSDEPGVHSPRFYYALSDSYSRISEHEKSTQVQEEGVRRGLFLRLNQRSIYNVKHLTGRPIWTPEQSGSQDLIRDLEENWEAIRDEAKKLLNAERPEDGFYPESEHLRREGDWKQYYVVKQGQLNQYACATVPVTCALLRKYPQATTNSRGSSKFSLLAPGTLVWPHCAPTNCRLRIHLGLIVPEATGIRIANETRTWQEGKVLILDDSFEHEVWNNSTKPRVILIVDIWHPELTPEERKAIPSLGA